MTSEAPPVTLVHVADPSRLPTGMRGIDVVTPLHDAGVVAERLLTAAQLVVDDALAFPFESLRLDECPVPTLVRLPDGLDGEGLRQVLGTDVLVNLSPLDLLSGPEAPSHGVLRGRHLPTDRWVGNDLDVPRLVDRARQWRHRFDEQWRPQASPSGWPLDVVDTARGVPPGAQRLARIRDRLLTDQDVLRRAVARLVSLQPRTRELSLVVASRRPSAVAGSLPPAMKRWTAIELVPGADPETGMVAGAQSVVPPPSLRVPLRAGTVDAVVVAADLLHNRRHVLVRLFAELCRLLRPGGTLVLLADVVPSDRTGDRQPLSAEATLEVVAHASGQQLLIDDVEAVRLPGETTHRRGLFTWRYLGAGTEPTWM